VDYATGPLGHKNMLGQGLQVFNIAGCTSKLEETTGIKVLYNLVTSPVE
jgi:hypothetical protein